MSVSASLRNARAAAGIASADLFPRVDGTLDLSRSGSSRATAVSFGPETGDDMRDRLRRAVDRFVDVRGMSDRDAAAALRALEIDVAVDLKGFTRDSRPGILALEKQTAALLKADRNTAIRRGVDVATLHFSQVWPLSSEQFIGRLESAGSVVCIEGNV